MTNYSKKTKKGGNAYDGHQKDAWIDINVFSSSFFIKYKELISPKISATIITMRTRICNNSQLRHIIKLTWSSTAIFQEIWNPKNPSFMCFEQWDHLHQITLLPNITFSKCLTALVMGSTDIRCHTCPVIGPY